MAGRTKKGYWRLSFSHGLKKRSEISLSSKFSETQVLEFERLVKLLYESKQIGTHISPSDMKKIDILPSVLRKKLASVDLIESNPDELIPTIGKFLEQYRVSRVGVSKAVHDRDKRFFNYLLEYFDSNKRIDLISPVEAGGLKDYLMNKRTAGHGKLVLTSANKVISEIKTIFNYAVDCGFLARSPFAKVKGGPTSNPDREEFISYADIEKAISTVNRKNIELGGILAFARYAGLRIPSEIKDLKFSSFEFKENKFGQEGIFNVPISGKTGHRRVPFFSELQPHFLALYNARQPDQEFVFEKYRTCKNIATIIKKLMKKDGLYVWEKFFINLRSSCITDKERLGWSRSTMDAVFGNSDAVRRTHYIQPMPDDDYAKIGQNEKKENKINDATIYNSESRKQDIADVLRMFSDNNGKIPAQIFASMMNMGNNFTLMDIYKFLGLDSKKRDDIINMLVSNEDLAFMYASLNALLESSNGKTIAELSEKEQIERSIKFVQNVAEYFGAGMRNLLTDKDKVE